MVDFGVLGPLEVREGGCVLPIGGPRQRAVLARLLLGRGRVVSSERLIEDVWEAHPPASASKILQKYVSELRKVLPPRVIETRGAGYVIESDDLDSVRFELLVGEGRYADGLALWRGDLLADLPDAEFVRSERTRLEELRVFATEGRIEADLAAGDPGALLGELAALAEANPLRERPTSLLMLGLYRAGRQLEALAAFDAYRRRLVEEAGVDPPAGLAELQLAILHQDPALDLRPRTRGQLPRPLTSFVGRAPELEALTVRVPSHRLTTLVGPGGAGKTRLAIELCWRLQDRFADGVWLVDFTGVESYESVTSVAAVALGVDVRHAPDELSAIVSALAHRPHRLLILDNCEYLVAPIAALAVAVLEAHPDLRLLATSRRPLGIDGEYVRALRPLPDEDAAALFSERAALYDLRVTDAAAICARLDGLPLAIELVASQLRLLGPSELVARLGDQLAFTGRARPAPRQRTLGDMVRWSYDLLPPETQQVFDRLGVFPGALSLLAAEAVCVGEPIPHRDVLGHMATLVDHSLLAVEPTGAATRYRLLETMRLFAFDRLVESGQLDTRRRTHALYYEGLARAAAPHFTGPEEQTWRARLEAEEANLQAALAWSAEHDPVLATRLGLALWPYWEIRWMERQGIAFLGPLLKDDVGLPRDLRARALTVFAVLGGNAGESREPIAAATEAVALLRESGSERELADALAALGAGLANRGHLGAADLANHEALTILRRQGDAAGVGWLLAGMSTVAMRSGDYGRALELTRQMHDEMVAVGSRRGAATALRRMAAALQNLGDFDAASALCREALGIWAEIEDPASVAHVQATLADVARLSGDAAGASRMYAEAMVGLKSVGDRRCMASTYKNLATLAADRDEHDQALAMFREALSMRHAIGDDVGLCEILEGMADLGDAVDPKRAAMLLGASAALRAAAAANPVAAEREVLSRAQERRRRDLGDARYADYFERGRGMGAAQVVDLALT